MLQKRRRREYRIARKAQFRKPEPGFSLYEGRTRGKKIRYTFSSDDEGSDTTSNRRSTRQSGISTPAEPEGPTFTASGRQVKSRHGGTYGETMLSGRNPEPTATPPNGTEPSVEDGVEAGQTNGRPRRSALRQEIAVQTRGGDHIEGYNSVDEMDDEEDAASSGADDYAGDDDGDDEVDMKDDEPEIDEEMSDEDGDEIDGDEPASPDRSLVVQLRYQKKAEEDVPVDIPDVPVTAAPENGPALPLRSPSITAFFKPVTVETAAVERPSEHSTSNGSNGSNGSGMPAPQTDMAIPRQPVSVLAEPAVPVAISEPRPVDLPPKPEHAPEEFRRDLYEADP